MRKLLSLLAGLTLFLCSQAQTNPIKHMDVFLKPLMVDSVHIDGIDTITTIHTFHCPKMLIDLNDTTGITTIEVSLGTTQGGSEIITKSFSYSNEGQFIDGTSYIREGAIVKLDLGTYLPISNCYATARVRRSDNSYSSPISFNLQ
jgi:hypothetical protein